MRRIRIYILLGMTMIAATLSAHTHQDSLIYRGTKLYSDSAIYQGINLRLDLFNSVLEAARTKGELQSYEMALDVRLKRRFFPTIEGGYAFGTRVVDGATWQGKGGFGRVGLDINGLKKSEINALLIGLRVCAADQNYDMLQVKMNNSNYWGTYSQRQDYIGLNHWDVWGELVAGCHVQVISGFTMGWYIRYKLLFTRNNKKNEILPYYIPGFGYRADNGWGFNYYIGWKF